MRGLQRAAIQGVLGVIAICVAGVAQAAVFPYTNDFSATGLPNAAPAANWSLSGGSFNNVVTTTTATSTATEQVTGVAGNDFVVTSHVTLNSVTTATNGTLTTIGFGIFAAANNFIGTHYLIDWTMAGTGTGGGNMRILRQGGGSLASSTTAVSDGGLYDSGHVPLATEFLMKVTGTYSGSTLSLAFSIWDSTGTNQIGGTATATDNAPLTGDFFGLRNRNPNTTASYNASFNDFNVVAVPEPASLGLIGMAGLPLLRRRYRRC